MCPDCGRNLPISVPQALLPAISEPESSAHTRRSKRRPYRRRALKAQVKCRPYGRHFKRSGEKLALGELGSAAGGFQAVLREFLSCFPLILRAFPAFCLSVIQCADHKKRPFSFSNSLMKRTIYYPKQLLWFIVLHFCIDVHSCFAVFVSGKVLDGLWINTSIEKIGDVSVP